MLGCQRIMKQRAVFSCVTLALLGLPGIARAQAAPADSSSLEAGGLKPPEAVQSGANPTPSAQTEAALDRAAQEDSGRGLEFVWLNAELGPQYLGLHTLKADSLVDGQLAKSKGFGMNYGAGLGVRLLAFTLGARFRFGNFSDWQLWTLDAEAGLHIPLGRIEPYFSFAAGYASLAGFDSAQLGSAPNRARGLDLRGGAGLDVYLSNAFSVGANLSADVLFLSRKAASGAASGTANAEQQRAASVYASDGSGIGVGATLSAVAGLHF